MSGAIDLGKLTGIPNLDDDDAALVAEIVLVGSLLLPAQVSEAPADIEQLYDHTAYQVPFLAAVAYAAIALKLSRRKATPASVWSLVKSRSDAADFGRDYVEAIRDQAAATPFLDRVGASMFMAARVCQRQLAEAQEMLREGEIGQLH